MLTKICRALLAAGIGLATFHAPTAHSATYSQGPGASCKKSGQVVHMNGLIFTCIKSGKKFSWSKGVPESKSQAPAQGGSSAGPSDKTFLYMKRIGMSCSTNGVFGFTGGMLAICKNNVVRYAMQSDLPSVPASGYLTRPAWYPTLAQQMGKTSEPSCAPSSIKFTSPIIPLDQLAPSIPYGAMIGGHVTPIDHAYIGIKSLYKNPSERTEADYVAVTSPADGTITSLENLGSPTSIRVVIDHGCNVVSVYMVLNKLSGVLQQYANELSNSGASKSVNIPIKAGQEFARQRDNSMDFNVWNGLSWLSGFVNPYSYLSQDAWKPYTVDPLPFFTSNIRTAIEDQMQRTSAPRSGKFDYDINGTASGNWFLDGTLGYGGHFISEYANATGEIPGGQVTGKNEYSWSHLAIAPHQVDLTKWIFSIGWWKDQSGDPQQFLLNIASGQPAPDKLTSASGLVVYGLSNFSINGDTSASNASQAPYPVGYTLAEGSTQGVVAIQINSDGSLSLEINSSLSSPSQFSGFTSAKRIYRR